MWDYPCLKIASKNFAETKAQLVEVMARRKKNDKSIPSAILTQFAATNIYLQAQMCTITHMFTLQ